VERVGSACRAMGGGRLGGDAEGVKDAATESVATASIQLCDSLLALGVVYGDELGERDV